ncbi:glycosyltransferase [Flavobacterium flavigenum]|uniref:glycosyltransferase n=1 Tax=Flavobacterium flavigenum TaxID=3003258 RepID=UPI00248321F3|nr:glycosyltransferase [Flavobacterium flavigenum]
MRVLFWVNSFPVVSETFIRNQIVDLIKEGIEVQIFCTLKNKHNQAIEGFEEYDLLNKTLDFSDILPKTKIRKIKYALRILADSLFTENFKYYTNFIRLLIKEKKYTFSSIFILHYILKTKIDIVHCHFGPVGNKAVFLKKIQLPIKLICTFHGYDIRLGIQKRNFYKDLLKYADSVISISNYNTKMLLSFGFKQEKIKELNNGVEVISGVGKRNNRDRQINILSVGRLVDEKGYDLALNSISNFHKKNSEICFHYDIIGGGILEEKLKNLCNDLKLDKIVTFHLSQNSEYVKSKMREADLFLLTSRNEAIPTVILEAQSYSLPVIATNVGAVKDLVINDFTGFLCDITEKDIEKCLKKMFDNRDRWDMYGLNASKNIILNYNRIALVQKLISIYKTI